MISVDLRENSAIKFCYRGKFWQSTRNHASFGDLSCLIAEFWTFLELIEKSPWIHSKSRAHDFRASIEFIGNQRKTSAEFWKNEHPDFGDF